MRLGPRRLRNQNEIVIEKSDEAERGQKLRASEILMLREKLKQKKFQRWRFLDFVFKIFFKTPHPNPLPASGERG